MNKVILVLIGGFFLFTACKKDRLTDDLDQFEGRYTWEYSTYSEEWWSNDLTYYDAEDADYIAEIEFNNEGRIFFYIDGEEVHSTRYKITNIDRSHGDGKIGITIDPAVEDVKEMDMNNEMDLSIHGDTLFSDDFPGSSYDESLYGSHYFVRN